MSFKQLFVFAAFLALVGIYISCRKTDQVNRSVIPDSQADLKFFSEHRSSDPLVIALSQFVKNENAKYGFVNKLVKKIGYPRWDKSIVTSGKGRKNGRSAEDSTNTVFIPFVADSQNIVNAALVINTTPIDTSFKFLCNWQYSARLYGSPTIDTTAENLALLFMILDGHVFGYTKFNITDPLLFSNIPLSPTVTGRQIVITNTGIGGRQNQIVERQNLVETAIVCIYGYFCGTPTWPGCADEDGCDYMSCIGQQCYSTTDCFTVIVSPETGGGGTGGTGGPGDTGGSGGGGSGGGWTPPDPPCGPTTPGRTATTGCEPGWEPVPIENEPLPPNPCEETATSSANATSLSQNGLFIAAKNEIIQTTDNKEHAVSFGKDGNGSIIRSAMNTGGGNSGSIPSISNRFADLHNHPGNTPPSSGDIYGFIDLAMNKPDYLRFIIALPSGNIYALVVVNLQEALQFNIQYPRVPSPPGTNFEPEFPVELVDEFNEINQGANVSKESTLAFILSKYNTGLALLKQDVNGNFKRLNTIENIDSNGNKTYTISNCE